MTKHWSDLLRPDPSSPDPMRDITERVLAANAQRLERQAERLIGRGYRVEELENRVEIGSMREPPRLNGKLLSIAPWGDIVARSGGPSDLQLAIRRSWRIFRPYKAPANQIDIQEIQP